jgi:hypothetical protein
MRLPRTPVWKLWTLAVLACGGGGPPTPASIGDAIPLGPFSLSIADIETASLSESSRRGEGLGLAVFLELTIPPPDPAVATEIAKLRDEEQRIGQEISNMRFTRRNFDDSELTKDLVKALERREELEEEAYRNGPRMRLLQRGIRVTEKDGKEYRPSGLVTKKTYDGQMSSGRGSRDQPFAMLALTRELGGYSEGASSQEWVLLFRLPPTARDLTLLLENPWRDEGQPHSVVIELGNP